MTFTVAFLLLAAGIAIGLRLPRPLARLRALYRRLTYKPALLRRVRLDADLPPARKDGQP